MTVKGINVAVLSSYYCLRRPSSNTMNFAAQIMLCEGENTPISVHTTAMHVQLSVFSAPNQNSPVAQSRALCSYLHMAVT